ncbi:hypothetical protein [Actinomyces faecalis]|uniref:hypothetical protein n=1 Tax=Actinomyces faecalis TaxID=2722820 RepID=UPI0015565FC3|nr:hypothetical protein [Actinomyces faecalis]
MSENPWLIPPPRAVAQAVLESAPVAWSPGTVTGVQGEGTAVSLRAVVRGGVWVVGAHGGAGTPTVTRLLGVVWVADAPGRLPRVLREQLALASGAYPASWCLPWVGAWRLAPAWDQPVPREISRVLHSVLGYREDNP